MGSDTQSQPQVEEKKIIVKLDTNWADEFDVETIWFTTNIKFEKWKAEIIKTFKPRVEIYFGTNEFIDFDRVEEIIDNLTTKEISEQTYNEMKDFLGEEFGLVSLIRILNNFNEE